MEKLKNTAVGVSLIALSGILSVGMGIAQEPELFRSLMNTEGTEAHNQNDVVRVEAPMLPSRTDMSNTATNILE